MPVNCQLMTYDNNPCLTFVHSNVILSNLHIVGFRQQLEITTTAQFFINQDYNFVVGIFFLSW